MKARTRITALLLTLLLSGFTSCAQYEPEGGETILDSLVIRTWVLDEQYEGNGVWEYEAMTRENGFNRDEGYWLTDDGERLSGDDVFVYERLELNKPRILAPMGYHYMDNVNFHLGYDGTVEIGLSELIGNEHATLRYSLEYPEEPWGRRGTAARRFTASAPMIFTLYPYGKFCQYLHLYRHTLVGATYYIDINTFDGDGTPIIEATLKLTAIEDPAYPFPDEGLHSQDNWSIYAPSDKLTRFLTVELIEYGFSDKYRFEYGIPDSDEPEVNEDALVGYY